MTAEFGLILVTAGFFVIALGLVMGGSIYRVMLEDRKKSGVKL